MITLKSVKKGTLWGQKNANQEIEYLALCRFHKVDNNINEFLNCARDMNEEYSMTMDLTAKAQKDAEKANNLFDTLSDMVGKDVWQGVYLYDFDIAELTKGTEFECSAVDYPHSEPKRENVSIRRIASICDEEKAFKNAKTSLLRQMGRKDAIPHVAK